MLPVSGGVSLSLTAEGKIVKLFIDMSSYYHPFHLQLHRAAGEAGVFVTVYEGRQYDKVDAVLLCVASVVIMAAEAGLDGGG